MNPIIVIEFTSPDDCKWWSVGWKNDHSLMARAKKAINEGRDPEEVVEFLTDAGFDVIEDLENAPTDLKLDN